MLRALTLTKAVGRGVVVAPRYYCYQQRYQQRPRHVSMQPRRDVFNELENARVGRLYFGWGDMMVQRCNWAGIKLTTQDRKVINEIDLKCVSIQNWEDISMASAVGGACVGIAGGAACAFALDALELFVMGTVGSLITGVSILALADAKQVTYDTFYIGKRRALLRQSIREKYGLTESE